MQQITDLGSDAKQTFRFQIEDRNLATFTFSFLDNQIGWYFDVEYDDFKTTGLRLVNSPNVLSAYENLIRFGLMCTVSDGAEPYFQNDFVTGRVNLYILNKQEVEQVREVIYAKVE